jgi:hypothetical protein
MDSDKVIAQLGRLELIETGRRRRWSETRSSNRPRELTEAGPSRGDRAAIWHFALVAAPMVTVVSPSAEACHRATIGLRTGGGVLGISGAPKRD